MAIILGHSTNVGDNRGTPFLGGFPLRGFDSMWGIKGGYPYLGKYPHVSTLLISAQELSDKIELTGAEIASLEAQARNLQEWREQSNEPLAQKGFYTLPALYIRTRHRICAYSDRSTTKISQNYFAHPQQLNPIIPTAPACTVQSARPRSCLRRSPGTRFMGEPCKVVGWVLGGVGGDPKPSNRPYKP